MGNKNKKAFSMIEILLVLVLLAILMAIGIPNMMQGKVNATAREEAMEIKADLELVKSLAKSTGGDAQLQWNTPRAKSTGYRIVDKDGVVKKIKTFDTKVYADFSGWPGSSVEFHNNGSLEYNGSFQVKINGTSNNRRFDFTLNKATGLIKMVEVK